MSDAITKSISIKSLGQTPADNGGQHESLSGAQQVTGTTRTFNVDGRTDVTIQDDIANDAEVTTITGLVLGGKAPSSVSIISGNDESPEIFAEALVANEAVVTIDDNTNVAEGVIDLLVRVAYDVTSVDYPVRVTVETP
jgi:hypothetical protein